MLTLLAFSVVTISPSPSIAERTAAHLERWNHSFEPMISFEFDASKTAEESFSAVIERQGDVYKVVYITVDTPFAKKLNGSIQVHKMYLNGNEVPLYRVSRSFPTLDALQRSLKTLISNYRSIDVSLDTNGWMPSESIQYFDQWAKTDSSSIGFTLSTPGTTDRKIYFRVSRRAGGFRLHCGGSEILLQESFSGQVPKSVMYLNGRRIPASELDSASLATTRKALSVLTQNYTPVEISVSEGER